MHNHMDIYRLRSRQRRLRDQLQREMASPRPDEVRVQALTHERLELGRRLAKLEGEPWQGGAG